MGEKEWQVGDNNRCGLARQVADTIGSESLIIDGGKR